jgi:hypothetical protein
MMFGNGVSAEVGFSKRRRKETDIQYMFSELWGIVKNY